MELAMGVVCYFREESKNRSIEKIPSEESMRK